LLNIHAQLKRYIASPHRLHLPHAALRAQVGSEAEIPSRAN
jgi:hypothetical protein